MTDNRVARELIEGMTYRVREDRPYGTDLTQGAIVVATGEQMHESRKVRPLYDPSDGPSWWLEPEHVEPVLVDGRAYTYSGCEFTAWHNSTAVTGPDNIRSLNADLDGDVYVYRRGYVCIHDVRPAATRAEAPGEAFTVTAFLAGVKLLSAHGRRVEEVTAEQLHTAITAAAQLKEAGL